MAPRTREQQDAYNAKRRAEAASKKTVETKQSTISQPVLKPSKPRHDLTAQVKALGQDSLLPDPKPKRKVIGSARTAPIEPEPVVTTKIAKRTPKAARIAAEKKPIRPWAEPAKVKVSKTEPKPRGRALTSGEALTRPINENFGGPLGLTPLKPKPPKTIKAQAAPEHPHGPPTTSRTYRRKFAGTGATARGVNGTIMQVSVTFSPEQYKLLLARADFYGASLPETIRKCVQAGPLSSPTST